MANPTNQRYYHISKSIEVLENNLAQVPNVTAWAELMNLSRSHFCKKFKLYFGKTPGKQLRIIRYKHLHKVIPSHPYETAEAIAGHVGLNNDQALYVFLSYHYDTNFTEFRIELLNGEMEIAEPGSKKQ